MTGKILIESKLITDAETISLQMLDAGIYFIRFVNERGEGMVSKLVVK
jgi:hypothetical protein